MARIIASVAAMLILSALCGKWALPFALLVSMLVHEAGHFLAAKLLRAKVLSVRGTPLGLLIKYDMLSVSPLKEIVICFAGSFLGIITAGAVMFTRLIQYDFVIDFILTSLTLSFINLLPVKGLDGGEILLCILESFTLPDMAYKISCAVSGSVSVIFWIITLRIQLRYGINMSMLVISVFLLLRTLFST